MSFDNPYPNDPNPYPSTPIDNAGSQTLYRSATGFEKALADTDAERLMSIHAELVIAQWDPYVISYNNLPFLAYAMGTNLWEGDYWNEGIKRDWTARQWKFKSLRGAPEAYRMALGASGYDITDMVRPPQGFYAAPNWTKAEEDAWVRLMPELRIYFVHREGTRGVDEIFCDRDAAVMANGGPFMDGSVVVANFGFEGQDAISIDDGWVLRGRKAIMRYRGVDTPLDIIQYAPSTGTEIAVDFERLSTIGQSTAGFVCDESASDDKRYVCFEEVKPSLYTLRLDRAYSHDTSLLSLTTVTSSLTPLTPRYGRNSDIGYGDSMMFEGDFASDDVYQSLWDGFADHPDGGDRLLADQIYLLDSDVAEPMTLGISFSDVSRVGLPSYTAELQINLHTFESRDAIFEEDYFCDNAFAVPEDDSHRERAFRAVLASKALRDTILVAFDPVRPLQLGDYLTEDSCYGDWIPHTL